MNGGEVCTQACSFLGSLELALFKLHHHYTIVMISGASAVVLLQGIQHGLSVAGVTVHNILCSTCLEVGLYFDIPHKCPITNEMTGDAVAHTE
jgi:hypothetical protein